MKLSLQNVAMDNRSVQVFLFIFCLSLKVSVNFFHILQVFHCLKCILLDPEAYKCMELSFHQGAQADVFLWL